MTACGKSGCVRRTSVDGALRTKDKQADIYSIIKASDRS